MDERLATVLKEMLVIFNREGRLVPPKLESDMCIALDRLGGEWLLLGLEAQGIEGASEIRCNPAPYYQILKGESGQRMVKAAIDRHRTAVMDMRRRVVSLIRSFRPDKPGMEFTIDLLPDSGDIYKMLSEWQKEGGLA